MKRSVRTLVSAFLVSLGLVACDGLQSLQGATGAQGATGPQGDPGLDGAAGRNGTPGLVAGTRIKPRIISTDDGMQAPTGTFWDEQRQEVCSVTNFNGVCRCLPTTLPVTTVYTNALCTASSRVLMYEGNSSGCTTGQIQYLSTHSNSLDCSTTNGKIYQKQAYTPPPGPAQPLYAMTADGEQLYCIEVTPPQNHELYQASGTEVDINSFAKCLISP